MFGSGFRSLARVAATAALVVLVTSPAWAVYVVILKDGTRISARERFKVQGEMALITLPNGTVTQIQLARIDVAASDKASSKGVGDAVQIEGGPKPSTPTAAVSERSNSSLQEVARQRRLKEEKKAQEAGKGGKATLAPYPDREIASAFYAALETAGIGNIQTFAGSAKGTIRIDGVADKEEQVFSALTTVARRYQEMKSSTSLAPERIELVLKTSTGEDAGNFSFNIDEAGPLLRGEVSVQEFFVRNVVL